MELDDGHIAKLTFEKGADGNRIISDAIAAWNSNIIAKTSNPIVNIRKIRPAANASSRIEIALNFDGGTFRVPVLINEKITLDFMVDNGAADVTIPADVVSTLRRTGTLTDSDFIGTQTLVLADGSKFPARTFRIRSLKVGNQVIENVVASTINPEGQLLLGQSFLTKFRSWSIDNDRGLLVLQGGAAGPP